MSTDTLITLPDQAAVDPWSVIDAIGHDGFSSNLLRFLDSLCGIDYCGIYLIDHDAVSELGWAHQWDDQIARERAVRYARQQYWRRDPTMTEVKRVLASGAGLTLRLDRGELPAGIRTELYPDIRDRIVISARRGSESYSLSLLRSTRMGCFGEGELSRLTSVAGSLLSAVAKHAEILARQPHLALASLGEIEHCLLADGRLTRREAQVCARLLFGLSLVGIALDLGISEETVRTYRSRAYARLQIGSPRELLLWYLSIWRRVPAELPAPEAERRALGVH